MDKNFLQSEERRKLIEIVQHLYDVSEGALTRRLFLEQAELRRFVPTIPLRAIDRNFAAYLVNTLEEHGFDPDRPQYHPLGALLSYIEQMPEVRREYVEYAANIINKYTLVKNADYLQQLRTKHEITDAPVVEEAITEVPPLSITTTDAEPQFQITFDDSSQTALEAIINSEDNFLDILWLAGAIYSAQAVCRIEDTGEAIGTGFLVAPDLILTNQHVLKNKDQLPDITVRFGYAVDFNGVSAPGDPYQLDPDFYHSSPPKKLDYALVRVESPPLADKTIDDSQKHIPFLRMLQLQKHRGYLQLADRNIRAHQRVNIVQHPGGSPIKAIMTQNYVVDDMTDERVHYLADTQKGSSGSPVFNKRWEVVALHHSGAPYPPLNFTDSLQHKLRGQFRMNEGIPMRAILKKIGRFLPE